MRRAEQWFTLVMLAITIAYSVMAMRLDVKLNDEVGPKAFPLLVAGVMVVVLVANLVKLLRETDSGEPSNLGKTEALFVLMGFAYVAAMVYVGYVFATVAFLLCGIRVMGEKRWLANAAVSVIAALVTWGLFSQLLGVTLPVSPLGFI